MFHFTKEQDLEAYAHKEGFTTSQLSNKSREILNFWEDIKKLCQVTNLPLV